jgi:serine/threonine protein kinase
MGRICSHAGYVFRSVFRSQAQAERSESLSPNIERITTEFWNFCEGQAANSYPLQNWLGGGGNSAVYATLFGEDCRPAAIKLVQFDGPDSEEQLDTWAEISRLSHPGLLCILDSGRCEVHGVPLLYVVMERAEGNLAEVLKERSLTTEETREMLSSAAGALTYLHEHGFAHGRVKAENIMAVGEQIKLTTDSVVRANEGAAAEDVRSLGLTVVRALTQESPGEGAGLTESLTQPFQDVVEHCLEQDVQSRWTASQILSSLRDPVVIPAVPAQMAARPSRVPLYSIVAAMIVITAIVLLLRSGPRDSSAPVQPTVSQAPVTPLGNRSMTVAALRPAEPAPPVTPKRLEPVRRNESWYVVAATYTRKADAERRAQSMTSKWPSFKAEIYSPPVETEKPYYLVILGSNLSQEAAVELQQRAIAGGLPKDTYIQHAQR